jgi:hypothetical protein
MRSTCLLAAPLLLVLVACPPIRGGGGGGAGDDDDGGSTNGALVYSAENDYYGGYQYAMLAFRPEGTVTCSEWVGSGYDADDLGGEWVQVWIYRGLSVPWEQTYYGMYDEENDCGLYDDDGYDYSDLHCLNGQTSDGAYLSTATLTITSWSNSRVRGNLSSGLIDVDFDVSNCGEYVYGDDDDSNWDDDDSAARDEEREEPGAAGSRWRLRIR